jgi:hypothetical protein
MEGVSRPLTTATTPLPPEQVPETADAARVSLLIYECGGAFIPFAEPLLVFEFDLGLNLLLGDLAGHDVGDTAAEECADDGRDGDWRHHAEPVFVGVT